MRKGRPASPSRTCEYSIGPGDVSFTSSAAGSRIGRLTTRPTRARTASRNRFSRPYQAGRGGASTWVRLIVRAALLMGGSVLCVQEASTALTVRTTSRVGCDHLVQLGQEVAEERQ